MISQTAVLMLCVRVSIILVASVRPELAQPVAATLSHCALQKADGAFTGTCGPLFDENPMFTLTPSSAVTSGVWRSDIQPTAVWTGTMNDDSRKFPAELEMYRGGRGILRTEYGWLAVSNVASSPTLRFDLDASHEIKPNMMDRRIVERASALLSSPTVWNRADNRICPATASTWSIYCGMEQATIDVTGAANHRRPAMEAVREIVDERSAARNYHHRLMDYNNDPTTRMDDVRSLFSEVLAGMNDPRWLTKHGFAVESAI
jgi:hypothetical protein